MSKFVIKCKGRGYLFGSKIRGVLENLTEKDVKEKNAQEQKWHQMRQQWAWYNKNSVLKVWTTDDTHMVDKRVLTFKRNLSDVPKELIFDSVEDAKAKMAELKTHPDYNWKDRGEISNIHLIDKCEVIEYDKDKVEKRVLKSKKKNYYTNQMVKLRSTGRSDKPLYCNHCGCLLYEDEPVLDTQNARICVHCLVGLAKDIEEAYENLPEKYKEDWLLARSMEI